ncbi:hypothetical protein BJ166DRAFT_261381 [Pestalotiopsis sp. NC0098]|nr:hypothetical protein BJ166DRAFT_261381 [Pestalotiopsis sp. NC0098]
MVLHCDQWEFSFFSLNPTKTGVFHQFEPRRTELACTQAYQGSTETLNSDLRRWLRRPSEPRSHPPTKLTKSSQSAVCSRQVPGLALIRSSTVSAPFSFQASSSFSRASSSSSLTQPPLLSTPKLFFFFPTAQRNKITTRLRTIARPKLYLKSCSSRNLERSGFSSSRPRHHQKPHHKGYSLHCCLCISTTRTQCLHTYPLSRCSLFAYRENLVAPTSVPSAEIVFTS